MTEESTAKLTRPRFVRFTEPQDEKLTEIANGEGCTVSDLLRRAAIQAFSLPTNGRISAVSEEREPATALVAIGTNPDNGGAS